MIKEEASCAAHSIRKKALPKHNTLVAQQENILGLDCDEESPGSLTGVPLRATTDAFLLNFLEKSLSVPSDQWAATRFTPKILSIYEAAAELRNAADKLFNCS